VHPALPETPDAAERAFIDEVIASQCGRPGNLLGVLQAVQNHNPRSYLPLEILQYVASKTQTPPSQVYSVATFYAQFNMQPQGDNTVCVCRGTACHTRGSRELLESVLLELGLGRQEDLSGGTSEADKLALTTPDQKFTVRTVACFGQCALAPVVEINHNICGHVNEHTLQRQLRELERESK
jgi:NADH-quinone oxidoreductase subunit E